MTIFQEIYDETFENTVFSLDNVSDSYSCCRFTSCGFQGLDLEKVSFSDCRFEFCNLSLAILKDSTISFCKFVDCKLTAINWTELKAFSENSFSNCRLTGGIFQDLKLNHCSFKACDLRGADFEGSQLQEVSFKGAELSDARFNSSNLKNADFREARGYKVSPIDNQIVGAKFSLPEALSLLDYFSVEIS